MSYSGQQQPDPMTAIGVGAATAQRTTAAVHMDAIGVQASFVDFCSRLLANTHDPMRRQLLEAMIQQSLPEINAAVTQLSHVATEQIQNAYVAQAMSQAFSTPMFPGGGWPITPPPEEDQSVADAVVTLLAGSVTDRCWRYGPMKIKLETDCPPGITAGRVE